MLSIGSNAAVPAQAQIKVQAARREADQAATQLEHLPESEYREALLEFCARSVERSS